MPYQTTTFDVMIASPGDVQVERNIAREVIYEWNAIHSHSTKIVLHPVGWETHSTPRMGDRPQAIINKQLLEMSDLLIAIFWTRLGTPTGEALSGTVEEIDKHLESGKPVMVYFSSVPVRLESVDEEQYRALKDFRRECEQRGLVDSYESPTDFRNKLGRHLAATINDHEHFKISSAAPIKSALSFENRPDIPELSKEAMELLLEASKDPRGCIMHLRHLNGMDVITNNRSFVEQGSSRSRATWVGAVDELAETGLIKDVGYKGEIFELTRDGYEVAELLSASA
jgi:hypothetical protein